MNAARAFAWLGLALIDPVRARRALMRTPPRRRKPYAARLPMGLVLDEIDCEMPFREVHRRVGDHWGSHNPRTLHRMLRQAVALGRLLRSGSRNAALYRRPGPELRCRRCEGTGRLANYLPGRLWRACYGCFGSGAVFDQGAHVKPSPVCNEVYNGCEFEGGTCRHCGVAAEPAAAGAR